MDEHKTQPATGKKVRPPSPAVAWLEEHIKPDVLKSTLDANFETVRLIQLAILIRQPTAFVGLFLAVNAHFYAYMILEPPAYCVVLLALSYYYLIRGYWGAIWPPVRDVLFPDDPGDGDANETNRIRTTDELVPLIVTIATPVVTVLRVFDKLLHVHNWEILNARLVLWLCLFAFTAVDFFWIFWAAANVILLLPGALYYPPVRELMDIVKSMVMSQLANL